MPSTWPASKHQINSLKDYVKGDPSYWSRIILKSVILGHYVETASWLADDLKWLVPLDEQFSSKN